MNDALLPLQIKMYAYNAFPVPLAARSCARAAPKVYYARATLIDGWGLGSESATLLLDLERGHFTTRAFSGRTDSHVRRERQTHRHTDLTLAAHAHRGLNT